MKLYLVQHGEAVNKDVDPDRPLTESGITDVTRVGLAMAQAGIRVERIVHSGKTRARQTAEIIAGNIATGVDIEVSDKIDPLDDPAAVDWQVASNGKDTMLVGHLPFMAKLAAWLVCGDAAQALVAYQPGSVVCLESGEDKNWQIGWMLRPELLA